MKKLIILLFMISTICTSQIKDFFKYSTFYASMTTGTSFVEQEDYRAVGKGYEDVTVVNPYDYNLTIGLRKIARFDYEYKVKTWYYGTEDNVADNVTNNQNFWLRYLGNSYVAKAQYADNQRVNLKYMSTDLRFRVNVGNWDLTAGVVGRIHPVYGVNPIRDFWVPGSSNFQDIAQDFGYAPEQWVQGFYVDQNWYDVSSGDSVLLATSNDEFFNHYFGEAVARFNERELDKLGLQRELSAVIGVAYYKYTNKMWLHAWANCLPIHHGLDEYSFEYGKQDNDNIEWDAGVVFGSRLTKSLGMFVEGTHQRYWMKPVYEIKFGFNYLIF